MTEVEWLECGDIEQLLAGLPRSASRRKLRLFLVACCRRAWHTMTPVSRSAVERSELFADGEVSWREMGAARTAANRSIRASGGTPADQMAAAIGIVKYTFEPKWIAYLGRSALVRTTESEETELAAQVALLRDIFGNPFRPVTFSPAWRTGTAVSLARTMYDARDFSAMPILADALQDAGCDSDAILAHCRDTSAVLGEPPAGSPKPPPATHVRGCWVTDLVLGKS